MIGNLTISIVTTGTGRALRVIADGNPVLDDLRTIAAAFESIWPACTVECQPQLPPGSSLPARGRIICEMVYGGHDAAGRGLQDMEALTRLRDALRSRFLGRKVRIKPYA